MSDSNIVRIFISSTFSDFHVERDALQKYVFPKLQALCEQHGLQFQAIDPRWGITREDIEYNRMIDIHLEEIRRSKEVSPKPNFLFLLGERLGWYPIPSRIPQEEFKELIAHLSVDSVSLLEQWYREDRNAVPATHNLCERVGIYRDEQTWNGMEQKLRTVLLEGVNLAGWSSVDPRRIKYEAAAIEQEFFHGALQDLGANENVLCILRTIHSLPEKLNSNAEQHFAEINKETGEIDKYAQFRITELKEHVQRILPENYLSYDTTWTETGPDYYYVEQMCQNVYDRLSQLIYLRIEERKKRQSVDLLETEIMAHENHGYSQQIDFVGRETELAVIQQYITEERPHPLIVSGLSGTGKSALLAKASQEIRSNSSNAIILRRFIGITPASFEMNTLAKNLCEEVDIAYQISESYLLEKDQEKDWTAELRKKVTVASEQHPLILFIDGLNQVIDRHRATQFIKLFASLPAHVRVVISLTPDMEPEIKESLSSVSMYKLGDMLSDGEALLDKWLMRMQRTLQPDQREFVLQHYRQSPRPLYLRLLLTRVAKWYSWEKPEEMNPTIEGAIGVYLSELERKHGYELTSRSLSYLVTSRYGLSEQEWYGILSKDKKIIQDIQTRNPYFPFMDEMPRILFSQLFWELSSYVTDYLKGESHLYRFRYSSFNEAIIARYLREEENKRDIQKTLIDYLAYMPLSQRTIEELPWLLLQCKKWDHLTNILSDDSFLSLAWEQDRYGVLRYWSEIEENTSIRKREVYKDAVANPRKYPASFVETCGKIFHLTSCHLEALTIFAYLQEEAKSRNDKKKEAGYLNDQAKIYEKQGDLPKALAFFKEAEAILRGLGEQKGSARYEVEQVRDDSKLRGISSKATLVRLFISSTFSDFEEERNALRNIKNLVIQKVHERYPENPLQFQEVDLRWGVSEIDAVSQRTMSICKEELKRCQELSSKPNFLFLLGDRYGWQPLPEIIPKDEYLELSKQLDHDELIELKKWYWQDKNAKNDPFVLRGRSHLNKIEGGYNWREIEKKLLRILRKAVNQLEWDEWDTRRIKYFASATEQEVQQGLLKSPTSFSDHVICVMRSIDNLPTYQEDPDVIHYLDIDEVTGMVDEYAQSRLSDLKERVEEVIPQNIIRYEVTWKEKEFMADHVNRMCQEVSDRLCSIIFSRLEAELNNQDSSELDVEIAKHTQYAVSQSKQFKGRVEELEYIRAYTRNSTLPLLVFGESGKGKSALMAKASELMALQNPSAVTIRRFIGVTPNSFDMTSLAESICQELRKEYQISSEQYGEKPKNAGQWIDKMKQLLAHAKREKPLLLWLDALNQLMDWKDALKLIGQLSTLPKYVSVVFSCTEDFEQSISSDILPPGTRYKLGDLMEGEQLLDSWLDAAGRKLQPFQREYLLETYYQCPRPLFLKLVFERARHWRSWENKADIQIGAGEKQTISEAIHAFLQQLEKRHGLVLTTRALSYLVLCKYGMSEQEWIEILSD